MSNSIRPSRPLKLRNAPEPPSIEGCKWIPLTKGEFALVDEADYETVSQWYWTTKSRPGRSSYAYRGTATKTVYLHRWLMGDPPGMDVDHRDGNGLNCRRSNLRICTHGQNQMNYRKCAKVTSSRFKGVTWDKSRQLWAARIKVSRKVVNLGRFGDEETAARAYDAKASELFGEFACLNFPNKAASECA